MNASTNKQKYTKPQSHTDNCYSSPRLSQICIKLIK